MSYIDPRFLILTVLLLLTLPLHWVLAAFFAAAFHELCHLFAMKISKVPLRGVKVKLLGAQIEAAPERIREEFFITAAGPLGSLLLCSLFRWIPRTAICAGAQLAFNLLPIYPLDGGRLLHLLLEKYCPRHTQQIERWIKLAVLTGTAAAAFCLSVFCSLGIFPLLLYASVIIRALPRKIPCKP